MSELAEELIYMDPLLLKDYSDNRCTCLKGIDCILHYDINHKARKEQDIAEVLDRMQRLDRSLKYCILCGRRLRPNSNDQLHKKCELIFDNVPRYSNSTGKRTLKAVLPNSNRIKRKIGVEQNEQKIKLYI